LVDQPDFAISPLSEHRKPPSAGPVRSIAAVDADEGGVTNANDNCTLFQNPDQEDTDTDTDADACDAAFNNDDYVGMDDFGLFLLGLYTTGPVLDLNSDGFVGLDDYGLLVAAL
jgi:hypothetical protein